MKLMILISLLAGSILYGQEIITVNKLIEAKERLDASNISNNNKLNNLKIYLDKDDWNIYENIPNDSDVREALELQIANQINSIQLTSSISEQPITKTFSQNTVWNAVSDFVVNRAKEELRLAFLSKLKKTICDGNISEYFHNTCVVLSDEDILINISGITTLREAFKRDLNGIVVYVPRKIIEKQFGTLENKEKDKLLSAYLLGKFVLDVMDGNGPDQALKEITDDWKWLKEFKPGAEDPFSSAIISASVVFQSLNSVELGKLDAEKKLLWAKAFMINWKSVSADVSQNLNLILDTSKLKQHFDNMAEKLKAAKQEFDFLRSTIQDKTKSEEQRINAYIAYAETCLNIIDTWVNSGKINGWNEKLKRSSNIVHHVALRDYGSLVFDAADIIRELPREKQLPSGMIRLASFMAEIAQTKDSESAYNVINSYAASVGSYRVKRKTGWTFRLNSYLGAGIGKEKTGESTLKTVTSLIAPIGIEYSGAVGKGFSLGLFGQFIDVGSLASYRLTNDSNETSKPKIGFGQVFSPGVNGVLGFPDLPISLMIGYSWTPKLRKVENNTKNSKRFQISLVVDIPIYQ